MLSFPVDHEMAEVAWPTTKIIYYSIIIFNVSPQIGVPGKGGGG